MSTPLLSPEPGRTTALRRWVGRLLAPALLVLAGTSSALAQTNPYCNGASLGGGDTGSITSLSIAGTGFSNSTFSTPAAGTYYTSYPASVTTASLQAGATYSFTVNLSGTYSAVLWIDYNQNGVFDTSEGVQVIPTTGATTGTISFTVPVTATPGQTGLRIRTRLNGNTNDPSTSCASYGSGETQDYAVTITAAIACSGTPTAGTATASPASLCAGGTSTLALTGATVASGLTYQWQSSTTSATTGFTNITGATSSFYTTPVLTQTTYYRAVLTCSGQSATSAVATVTVLVPAYATLPYTQSFENTWISRCGTNDVPDNSWLNTPVTGNTSWRRDDDGASASWTSPTFPTNPYGTGVATGSTLNGTTGTHSARFHNYYANSGDIGRLDLYVNLGGTTGTPTLKFDYVNPDSNPVVVLLSTNGGATFSATPLQTLGTQTAWTSYSIPLPTGLTATSVIRFQATGNFGSYDNGLDNVSVAVPVAVDIAPTALATPTTTQGCYGSAETVAVTVTNRGAATLNFATNPATVTAVVTTPGGPQTLTGTLTTGTLAVGATQTVTLTPTLNMTALGTYSFAITATVVGDLNTSNDVLTPAVTRTAVAPVAGTLAASATSVCVSGPTTLTLTGSANGSIQLQSSSSASGPFTNISGATSASYTTPVLTSTTYYRTQVTCNTNVGTSNVVTVTVSNPVVASAPAPAAVCAGQPATLTATSAAGTSVRFFSTATGGTALTGATTSGTTTVTTSQVTPALTTAGTTTFYAEAFTGSTETAGRAAPTVTTGFLGVDTGLIFSTTTNLTIQSAVIYPIGTGTITFALRNSAGVEIQATPALSVTGTGAATPVTVPLGLVVPAAGTGYQLVVKAFTGLTDLLRENPLPTGVTFPITSPSGSFSITNGINSAPLAAYYYFYNIQLSTACVAATRTAIQVTVNPAANASFGYGATSSFCRSQTTTQAAVLGTGAAAGTFSASPATGLTINATTGAITPSTSTAGTYTVTNTIAPVGVACGGSATTTVTITAPPVATFSYPAASATTSYCAGATGTVAPVLGTGSTAGTFTISGTGAPTINATTGALNLTGATASTYTVTNTIAASGGCGAVTSTATVTVLPLPTATLTAPTSGATAICQGSSVVLTAPTGTGLTYQFFNGTTSLGAASATNTLTVSAAGSYSVVVTSTGGCAATSVPVAVTVSPLPATPTVVVSGTPATGLTLTATSTTSGVTYQFFRNGVLVTGTTGNTLLVNSGTNNGTYTVVAVSAQGCSSAASAATTVTVTATAGAAAAAAVRLFPNPTPDGRVSVELTGYPKAATLTVLNTLGQVVVQAVPAANGITVLDLHELASGVYLLQVQATGATPQTLRVVKN